jgi:hypothetical protein
MRSDGDAWEYGEEGDAGKEDRLRNIQKHIPRGEYPALPQSSNKRCKCQVVANIQRLHCPDHHAMPNMYQHPRHTFFNFNDSVR